MKLKDVMKTIEKLNELREALNISKAYVNIYFDDIQLGDEFQTLNDLMLSLKREYIPDFWMKIQQADFSRTYNNTLTSVIDGIKVDLFVDC